MVFSYYLYKYPYKLIWYLKNVLVGNNDFIFYCADPLDYEMFLHISKYLPKLKIIAKDNKSRKYFDEKEITYFRMPSFPRAVIMGRHTPYKFPVNKIIKFGFDHGLYQFKRWTSPKNYNDFDIYFVSSEKQVETARRLGITSVKAVGYPKLDNAFNGVYNEAYLNKLRELNKIDLEKKTLIFTTTWNVAGLSAIDKWIDRIEELSGKYNILVTVHTWTHRKYKMKLDSLKNIIYLKELDVTPYLMIADILIGDYSSIIGEFCAFNKPIITFRVPESDRTIPEITELLKIISIQINRFDEIYDALDQCFNNPTEKAKERQDANKILFYKLDGKAGKRIAESIMDFLTKKAI